VNRKKEKQRGPISKYISKLWSSALVQGATMGTAAVALSTYAALEYAKYNLTIF
jgi:hypothetical protein